jgi:hypothetical protein
LSCNQYPEAYNLIQISTKDSLDLVEVVRLDDYMFIDKRYIEKLKKEYSQYDKLIFIKDKSLLVCLKFRRGLYESEP